MKSVLTYFVTLNKLTKELTLKEGSLISFKISKSWQKPDSNTNNPALWVCHLPDNPLKITYVSLYSTELVIKKKNSKKGDSEILEDYEKELEEYETSNQKEDNLLVYKGTLEPNGETEKEIFYRCQLKLQKEKENEEVKGDGNSGIAIAVFFILLFIVLIVVGVASGGFR